MKDIRYIIFVLPLLLMLGCSPLDDDTPVNDGDKVTLTLMPQDGVNMSRVEYVNKGEISGEPAYTPNSKKGHTFAGWYVDEE